MVNSVFLVIYLICLPIVKKNVVYRYNKLKTVYRYYRHVNLLLFNYFYKGGLPSTQIEKYRIAEIPEYVMPTY